MGRSVKRGDAINFACKDVSSKGATGLEKVNERQREGRKIGERERSDLEVVVAWRRHLHVYNQSSQYNAVSKFHLDETYCLYPKALIPYPAIPLLNVLCSTGTQAQEG